MYKYISLNNYYIIDTQDKSINSIPLNKFKGIINNRMSNSSDFENFKTRLTTLVTNNMFPGLTRILEIEFNDVVTSLYANKDIFMIIEAIDWIDGRIDKLDVFHFPSIEILCIDNDLFFLSPDATFPSSIKLLISNISEQENLCNELKINTLIFRNMLNSLILQLENIKQKVYES